MESTENLVTFLKKDRIGIIILNRPEKLNALNIPLIKEFEAVMDAIARDDDLVVIILTGSGRAFCVGADLDMLADLGTPKEFRETMKNLWQKNFNAMEDMEKLFVAALNGTTMGGGLELALACDIRICAEGVVLALPEINYGIIPEAGGTIRLARLVGASRTKELALSGQVISCEEAKEIGLINRILPSEGFLDAVIEYSKKFADKSPAAVGMGKLCIDRSLNQDRNSALQDVLAVQSILLETPEYLKAFKEKRQKK